MRGFRTRQTKTGTLAIWKQPSHVHWVRSRMTAQSVESRLRIITFHARLRPNQPHPEQLLKQIAKMGGKWRAVSKLYALPASAS